MKSTSDIVEARLEFNLIIAGIIAAKSKPFFLDRNVLSKVSFCKSSQIYMYILLTKREVKMAGYWPRSLFAFLWTETKSRSIKMQKEI